MRGCRIAVYERRCEEAGVTEERHHLTIYGVHDLLDGPAEKRIVQASENHTEIAI